MRCYCLRAFFCLAFTGGTWLSLATAAFADPAAQIFWTDRSTGRILRADLDGSNIQTIYQVPVILDPCYLGVNRLAVDESQAVIYWSDTAAGTIQRMPLAGGAPQTIASGVVFPRDLEIDTAAGKLYWSAGAQVDAGGIFRANLDGSQLETLVPTILSPGIALDLQAGHLYYAQFGLGAGPNTIHRVSLDGSSPQLLVPSIKDPDDVELDLVAGKMYYINEDDGQFFRANLDGSGAEKIIDQFFEPGGHGLAVHHGDGKLYWSSSYGVNAPEPPGFLALGRIGRSNLDGSNFEILISGGLNQGMVVAAPVPEPASLLLASIAAGFVALTVAWRRVRR